MRAARPWASSWAWKASVCSGSPSGFGDGRERRVEVHVGECESLGQGEAFEGDIEEVAHRAVGAVAAGEETRAHPFDARRTGQLDVDAGGILRQGRKRNAALDRDAVRLEGFAHHALRFALRDHRQIRVRGGQRAEIGFDQLMRSRGDLDAGNALGQRQQLVGDAGGFQQFQRAGLNAQRLRAFRAVRRPVHDAKRHAETCQFQGQRHAGGAGSANEDGQRRGHRILLPRTAASAVSGACYEAARSTPTSSSAVRSADATA
jgi:hypothetical protein